MDKKLYQNEDCVFNDTFISDSAWADEDTIKKYKDEGKNMLLKATVQCRKLECNTRVPPEKTYTIDNVVSIEQSILGNLRIEERSGGVTTFNLDSVIRVILVPLIDKTLD